MARRVATALIALLPYAALAGSNAFGKQFLEENKGKPGVVTLPSGLQFRVLEEGDGEAHPLANTDCTCHCKPRNTPALSHPPASPCHDCIAF